MRQKQVIENEIDNQISKVVRSEVMTVKNCIHDTLLTAINNLVIPRVEMAMNLITGSMGYGTNTEGQNPDPKDFPGIIRNSRSCRPQFYLVKAMN